MISKEELKQLMTTENGRIAFIDLTHGIDENNFQSNKTPMSIIRKMCEKTSLFDKKILVLFNLEFLEALVYEYKVPRENIYVICDSILEKTICEKLYGCYSKCIPEEVVKRKDFIYWVQEMSKRFDLCFSNPPYNRNVDLKILKELEPICDEMVVVHPSTWLLDLKGKKKLYNDFKSQIRDKAISFELFNGNPVFGIGLFVPCVISHLNGNNNRKIKVINFGEEFEVSDIDDITKFGSDWLTIAKPFFEQMKKYCQKNGSVWDFHTFKVENDKHYCQFATMIGNWDKSHERMFKDDFYTMVMKDPERNKGIRQPKIKGKTGSITPTFSFKTEIERDNFIGYVQTDFARFCLSLIKNSQSTYAKELSLIPYLDFTEKWDDKKLFKHFHINQETQDYIKEFLPDYHNIR